MMAGKCGILCTIRVEDAINGGVRWSIHEAPEDEELIQQSAWSYYPISHYLETEIIPELHQRTDFYYGAIMYAHETYQS